MGSEPLGFPSIAPVSLLSSRATLPRKQDTPTLFGLGALLGLLWAEMVHLRSEFPTLDIGCAPQWRFAHRLSSSSFQGSLWLFLFVALSGLKTILIFATLFYISFYLEF